MIPVSAIVMTRNEAANIACCLQTLQRFDQVFVVDSASTDGTREITAKFGATVVPFQWNGCYPKKKQWCLDNLPLRHPWVLYCDADERITSELADEIALAISGEPVVAGYFIRGQPVFGGVRHRHGAWNCKLALIDRRRASFPSYPDLDIDTMWEVEGHYQPVLQGQAGLLRHAMIHDEAVSLHGWFDRHNRYSDWEAALLADGRHEQLSRRETGMRRLLKAIFAKLPGRPIAAFLHSYLLRLGLLDGVPGFDRAVARAFYYWQIDVKLRVHRRGPSR
ncbi:glycosyltransferase involved in cell wall biosynthesis [Skermanella aerolata]|uniref:glycosyltransferase family 2 protein n=1 Tax=Skermanella aerolata TaxID=393310 RepID=UPI003D24DA3E